MNNDPFSEFPNSKPSFRGHKDREHTASTLQEPISTMPKHSGWSGWTIRQRLLAVLVVSFLGVAATAASLFILGRNSFDPDRVQIKIDVPRGIVSGAEVVFDIKIINNNSVHLEDGEFVFTFPEGALQLDDQGREREADPVRFSINRIRAGEELLYSFATRLLGDPEADQFAKGSLRYRPSSINAQFESRKQAVVRVERSPIELSLEVPKKAIGGEEVFYVVKYSVSQDLLFDTARIVVEYPDEFHFLESSPESVGGTENQWELLNPTEGDNGEITIRGNLDGITGQIKRLRVVAGEYRGSTFTPFTKTEKSTIIDTHPLALDIDVKGSSAGSADIGSSLIYTIFFRNDADVALRELILRARPVGSIIDLRKVEAKGASFLEGGELIEWTAASVPELALLAPGEEAEVTIFVPLKKSFPIYSSTNKNFKALLEVELETPTVPESFAFGKLIGRATSEVKINSDLTIQQLAFYNETSSSITNSGPHPPRVGERTTYTVHWRILNSGNDLSNVIVRSTLPSGIDWTGRIATAFSQTQLRFNDRTREIVWDIGSVPATTGVIRPTYEVVFQVSITPSLQQEGGEPVIIDAVEVEAIDQFTGAFLKENDKRISTDLPDDPIARGGGRVDL